MRPMHVSLRRFFTASIVCFSSLSIICVLHLAKRGVAEVTVDTIGAMVFAVGFGLLASMGCVIVLADCMRHKALRSKRTIEIRKRLATQTKSCKYAAIPEQLRGMTVGAIFFGLACGIAIVGWFAG